MKSGTFERTDYLAIGPHSWGRGPSAREAWARMVCTIAALRHDAECIIVRLTDNTDTVHVMPDGYFIVESGERQALCGRFRADTPGESIPEQFVPGRNLPSLTTSPRDKRRDRRRGERLRARVLTRLDRMAHSRPADVIHREYADGGRPFLLRWHLLPPNRFLNASYHVILHSDRAELHYHQCPTLGWILDGSYHETLEHGARVLEAGSLTFRGPAMRHRIELFPSGPDEDGAGLPVRTLFIGGPFVIK